MRSEPAPMPRHSRGSLHAALLAVVAAALVWSAVRPYEYGTWLLEVLPVLVAIPLLALTYRRYRLTDLTYVLIAVHAIILVVGGHYTYARVPLGDWFRDTFELSRNHYDRLGHFAQGFVPAIIAREVLLRSSPLRRGRWLAFLVVSVCLAISASYEILEWQSAVWGGEAAGDFLGMQGDVWDAQKDMLLALIGAIAALLTLSRLHDREMPV
jgi:putative membrane protein